jgi:hypothetical protein
MSFNGDSLIQDDPTLDGFNAIEKAAKLINHVQGIANA